MESYAAKKVLRVARLGVVGVSFGVPAAAVLLPKPTVSAGEIVLALAFAAHAYGANTLHTQLYGDRYGMTLLAAQTVGPSS